MTALTRRHKLLDRVAQEGGYDAQLYELLHRGTAGDTAFYAKSCAGACSVLELGCGYGRVLGALTRSASLVVGVDNDAGLLRIARAALTRLPPAAARRVVLLEQDMAEIRFDCRFERVIVPFGGLQCLLTAERQQACLTNCRQLLGAHGRLVFDVYAADAFHADAPDADVGEWDDPEFVVSLRGADYAYDVYESSRWRRAEQRLDVVYEYRCGRRDSRFGVIKQRYLLEAELQRMLKVAGLRVISWHADFRGTPTSWDAERHVVVAAAAT